MKIALFYGDDTAPQVGQVGTYHRAGHRDVSFKVTSVDGNLCHVTYSNLGESLFIWRFGDGLNDLHDWPGKPHTDVDKSVIKAMCKGLYATD